MYAGLMCPAVFRNPRALPVALFGLLLLLVTYAELIAFCGMQGVRQGAGAAHAYQDVGSGLFFALPFALYWLLKGMLKPSGLTCPT